LIDTKEEQKSNKDLVNQESNTKEELKVIHTHKNNELITNEVVLVLIKA